MSNSKKHASHNKKQREEEKAQKTFKRLVIALVVLALAMLITFIVLGQ